MNEKHFLAAILKPAELDRLADLYKPVKDADAQWLIQDLRESNHIFDLYFHGAGNANSEEREAYMKRVFMSEYRRAEKLDGRAPKVIFKAGHWHALRGQNQNLVFTTGEMLSGFATANGSRAFVLTTAKYEPGGYMTKAEELQLLAEIADANGVIVVDLEALRPLFWKKKFFDNLPRRFIDLLYKADAALIMGGEKSSGSTELDAAK
jgi:hypothetical protein